jgi:hypothetical protein
LRPYEKRKRKRKEKYEKKHVVRKQDVSDCAVKNTP